MKNLQQILTALATATLVIEGNDGNANVDAPANLYTWSQDVTDLLGRVQRAAKAMGELSDEDIGGEEAQAEMLADVRGCGWPALVSAVDDLADADDTSPLARELARTLTRELEALAERVEDEMGDVAALVGEWWGQGDGWADYEIEDAPMMAHVHLCGFKVASANTTFSVGVD